MALEFRLSEFGRAFATRGRAEELREEMLRRVGDDEPIVMDFADVTNVTYSFADELVAKLVGDGVRVETRNMSASVGRTVQRAVERRRAVSCG